MIGSVIRHATVFIPLFIFLYIILMRIEMGPSLLVVFLIFTPAVAEVIQLGFPSQWGFNFEIRDIVINYFSSAIGITGGMILWHKPVIGAVGKPSAPK
jgi:hypothetical protein